MDKSLVACFRSSECCMCMRCVVRTRYRTAGEGKHVRSTCATRLLYDNATSDVTVRYRT